MNFVLDTNAVSELRKPRPNHHYCAWVDSQDPAHLFITTISLGEVWQGFHRSPTDHAGYESVKQFAANLTRTYTVLNHDTHAAAIWGELTAKPGGLLPLRDSFIGAIARSRGFLVVSRDVAPFGRMGLQNPQPVALSAIIFPCIPNFRFRQPKCPGRLLIPGPIGASTLDSDRI